MSRKIEPPKPGHIVEDYYIGDTHITICDDACVSTQAEIEEILYRAGDIYRDSLAAEVRKTQKTA